MSKDIRTTGIVLRRTDYGEADRILNILTAEGKISALAKGVRKSKSKLAGAIELFSYSELNFHLSAKKDALAILTGSRLIEHYANIAKDINAMRLAGNIMKDADRHSEQIKSGDFLDLLRQALKTLDQLASEKTDFEIIHIWWLLNLWRISGEELNLHTDNAGQALSESEKYIWSPSDRSLQASEHGQITSDHIKFLRLLSSTSLNTALRVNNYQKLLPQISNLVKTN